VLHEPLLKRRDALTDLLRPVRKNSPVIELSQTVNAPASEMIRAITGLKLEGIVAKRQDSLYESGKRSESWAKYKFVVGGYTLGNPFDAVIVGYYDGDKLLYAGKVRAGFMRIHGARSCSA
jgi:bifunctional non-homologous end joining protein LigD